LGRPLNIFGMSVKKTTFSFATPGNDALSGALDTTTMTITAVKCGTYRGAYRWGSHGMTPYAREEINVMDFGCLPRPTLETWFGSAYMRFVVRVDGGDSGCCVYFRRVI
jgi:hypothetical protein